ncbi:hypothetical protein D3C74_450960 [compost metagenome]
MRSNSSTLAFDVIDSSPAFFCGLPVQSSVKISRAEQRMAGNKADCSRGAISSSGDVASNETFSSRSHGASRSPGPAEVVVCVIAMGRF